MAGNGKPRFFYGYVVVAAAMIIMTLTAGSLYSFGVFFKPFLAEFGWSRAETSGVFSLSFFMAGLMGMLVGRLNDRFGPRVVTTVCGAFLGGGFMLIYLVSAIWQLYLIYGVIIALGVSAGVAMNATVIRWFVGRRGLMCGIAISGVGLGTVIMPPLANWLIANYNWRRSFLIIGTGILVLMLVAAQFLRRDPQQMGLTPYGKAETKAWALNSSRLDFSFHQAIRSREFWMLGILFICHTFCVQTMMAHVVLHAQGVGISAASAANVIAIIGGASIVGRLFLGTLLDRVGSRSILTLSFLTKTGALIWLVFARAEWMFYLFAAVFGLGYGGAAVSHSPTVADLFGLSALSLILAGVSFVGTLGAATGPVVAGYIFDVTNSYFWAFMICIVFSVAGVVITMFIKPVTREGRNEA